MPPPRFQWHPNARAFAGGKQVTPTDGPAAAHIAAHPVATALTGVYRALAANTPFCVSDTTPPALSDLGSACFATLTGGTSGTPKVIARTQSSWIASFHANAERFAYTPADSIAVLGALSHSLALYGLLEGLHLGLDMHALSPLAPSGQNREMRAHRCTILYATPTQLSLLPAGIPLPNLRLILCGGGTLGDATRAHITALCPNAALHVFYGAAETSFVTLSGPDTPNGSVGRAYPKVEIAIRDPDGTGTGMVWVRSPYLFERYLHGTSAHTRHDGDWLTVGEVGRLDPQGHLYLRGRAGRVINIADQTVYPEELEARFAALLGVQQCAVLACHDSLRGHRLIIVLAGPEDANTRKTLIQYCAANGLIAPRAVVFLDPFPLHPSGKPDLIRIAEQTGSIA